MQDDSLTVKSRDKRKYIKTSLTINECMTRISELNRQVTSDYLWEFRRTDDNSYQILNNKFKLLNILGGVYGAVFDSPDPDDNLRILSVTNSLNLIIGILGNIFALLSSLVFVLIFRDPITKLSFYIMYIGGILIYVLFVALSERVSERIINEPVTRLSDSLNGSIESTNFAYKFVNDVTPRNRNKAVSITVMLLYMVSMVAPLAAIGYNISPTDKNVGKYNSYTVKVLSDPNNLKFINGTNWTTTTTDHFIVHYNGDNKYLYNYINILEGSYSILMDLKMPEFIPTESKPSIYIDETKNNNFDKNKIQLSYVRSENIGLANEASEGLGNVAGLVPMVYTTYNDFRTYGLAQMFEASLSAYYDNNRRGLKIEYGGKSYFRYLNIKRMHTSFSLGKTLANDISQLQYEGMFLSYLKENGVLNEVMNSKTVDVGLIENLLGKSKGEVESDFTQWMNNPHGYTVGFVATSKDEFDQIIAKHDKMYYDMIIKNSK